MRALTASLSVVLGIAAVSFGLSACSDSTDSSGGGGAAGKTVGEAGDDGEVAGATNAGGGGASAGAPGGEAGAAGAACSFESNECRACLQGKCGASIVGCSGDNSCLGALGALQICACDGTGIDECKATFVKDGGDPATDVATCYEANCKAACEG